MKLTVNMRVISESGEIKFEPDQEVEAERIEKSVAYYGRNSGTYYPEKVIGVKLKGIYGIWFPQMFKELTTSKPE